MMCGVKIVAFSNEVESENCHSPALPTLQQKEEQMPSSRFPAMRTFIGTSLFISLAFITASAADQPSELFTSLKPIYSDSFDGGTLNTEFWEVRQNTTWKIKDGVLHGSSSSKEFQDKKVAEGDKGHAGFKPVIWLKKVPENFVCTMRVRYDGAAYQKGFPLLDLGHHIHTLTFSEKATTLTIKKNIEKADLEKPLFTLNQWHDVVIELRKGTLVVSIDGVKHRFESKNIDMTGQAQIDFKGIDHGTYQIDDVKLWQGVP
jgi:hypothetical protein